MGCSPQIDTSDKDDGAHMVRMPGVFGLGQPDTIKLVQIDGQDYIVMALEGDAKEYANGDDEWTDEEKGASFPHKMSVDTPMELVQVPPNARLWWLTLATIAGDESLFPGWKPGRRKHGLQGLTSVPTRWAGWICTGKSVEVHGEDLFCFEDSAYVGNHLRNAFGSQEVFAVSVSRGNFV